MAAARTFKVYTSDKAPDEDTIRLDFRVLVNTIAGKCYEIIELDGTETVKLLKVLLRYTIVPKPRESMMRLSFNNIVLDDTKRLFEYRIRQGSELDLVVLPPADGPRDRASRERSRRRRWRVREGLMGLDRCREV